MSASAPAAPPRPPVPAKAPLSQLHAPCLICVIDELRAIERAIPESMPGRRVAVEVARLAFEVELENRPKEG